MLLQETPAVLAVRKLCDEHGYAYHWKSGQNLQLIKNGKRTDCNISNYAPFVVPGISSSSSSTTLSSCLVTIFITGVNIGKQWFSIGEQVWKIQSQKEVEVRVKSFGETRWKISQKPKNKIKKKIWRKVQRHIWHELPWLATGIEWEFGRWKNFRRASGRPDAHTSSAYCIYALSEGSELWNMLEDQNNKGFLQKTR